jgi:hypothetical protein
MRFVVVTTLNLQVSASSDDARESSLGVVDINTTVYGITAAGAVFGARFLNVTIPPGSTIVSAVPQIYLPSAANDNPDFTVVCEDADDAATFTTDADSISTRPSTSATTAWSGTDVGTGFIALPDLVDEVQEVVSRSGWLSGNDLVIMLTSGASVTCSIRTYDHASTDAPKLDIDYAPGRPWPVRVVRTHYLVRQLQ